LVALGVGDGDVDDVGVGEAVRLGLGVADGRGGGGVRDGAGVGDGDSLGSSVPPEGDGVSEDDGLDDEGSGPLAGGEADGAAATEGEGDGAPEAADETDGDGRWLAGGCPTGAGEAADTRAPGSSTTIVAMSSAAIGERWRPDGARFRTSDPAMNGERRPSERPAGAATRRERPPPRMCRVSLPEVRDLGKRRVARYIGPPSGLTRR
jgi:hypothetical protein